MYTPLFTVVVPVYNKSRYLARTINSVLTQSCHDFELILVDDGSTDSSLLIAQSFEDSRIRVLSKSNGGVSSARNYGIERAIGKYVAFLDADDHWASNHLSLLAKAIEKYGGKADFFATNFVRVFPDGDEIPNRTSPNEVVIVPPKMYFKYLSEACWVHTSCICVSKKALVTVGGFDPRFSMGEDIHLWNRLARRYTMVYIPAVTSYYEIATENCSSGKKINYNRDAARVALCTEFISWTDFRMALITYAKYRIKRLIGYIPRVRK